MLRAKRKDGKVVLVTEKMYNYIYKDKGFELIDKITVKPEIKEEEVEDESLTPIDASQLYTMKNAELHQLLDEREIPYKLTDTKSELVGKLIG